MDDKKLLYDFLKGKKIINFSEQEFYNYISDRRKSDHLFSYLKENGNIDQEETADSFFSKYGGGTAPQKKNLGDTGQGVSPLSSGDERTAPTSDVEQVGRLERPVPRTFGGREIPGPVAPGREEQELVRQDVSAMQQQRMAQFPLRQPTPDTTEFGVKTANKAISEVNEAREARQKDEERKRPTPPAAPKKPIFSPSGDIIGFTGGEKGVEMLSYGKFEGGADITEAVRAGAKETKGLLTKLPGTLENMAIDISTDMALAFFPKEQREAAKRYLPQIKEAQKEALRKVPGNVLGKAVQQIENYGADAWAERQLKEAEEIRSRFDNADASIQQLVSERKYGEATQKAVFEGMSSVPGMLLAALPGGIYALGATSAVAKYRQLEEEFGKGQLGATEVFNAAATGAAEALTEKVTGRIMRNAGTAIGLGTDYVEGVLGKAVGKVFGRVGGEIAEESLSEVAAQVSENIIDKITVDPDRNIFSGWFDAAVVGGLMGGAVSGGGALIGGAGRQVKRHITEATASKVLSPALQNISNVITQAHSVIYTPEETTQATATEAVDAYIDRLPNFLARELGITEEEAKNSPQYQNAVNNRERLINDVIERNKAGQVTSPPETLAAIEEEKRLGISRMPSGGAVATAESERTFSDVTMEMANQIALPENATAADIETAVDEYLAGIQQADPDAFADQLTYRNEVIDYLTQQSQANATQEVQNVQPESRVGQPVGAQEVQDQAATETGIGDRAISGGVQPEAQVVAPEKISKTIETTTISKGKNKGQSRTVEQNNYIEKTEDTDVSVTEYEVNIGDRKVTAGGLEMTVGDFKQEFPLLYESEQSLIDSLDENSKIKIRKVKRTPSDSRFNSVVSIYHPFIGTADLSISKDDNKYNAEINEIRGAQVATPPQEAVAPTAPTATPPTEITTPPAETAPATPAPAAATKPALEIVESPDGTVGLQPNGTTVRSVDKPSAKEARKKALVSMAQRIKPLLNKIGVDIFFIDANSASDLALVYPEAAVTAMTTQRGTYLNTVAPVRPSILINTDFADVDTILHEAFHAAINAAFRTQPKELIGMMNAIKKLSILDKTKMSRELPDGTVEESTVAEQVERFVELYEADPEFIQAEEFLAELSSYIGRGFAEVKDTSLIARLERIVNTFLRRILGPNAPQVNWKTGNDVADFFNNLSRSLATGDIQMLAKAWRQFETKVRPQILGASGTPTTITTSTGDVQVRQQKGIINLTEQEVLAFSNIGITDKYMQVAARNLKLKVNRMSREGIEAAVQKAFDDLITNANSFVISQPSKQIEIEMLREAETARRNGESADLVQRIIEGAKDPQSNLYKEFFRKKANTQTKDLSEWTGYLSQSEYPVAFKYIMLESVLKSNYDALTNQFKTRDNKTTRSFTPFDAGSLATLFVSESNSLLKDYVEIHAANAVNVIDHHSFLKGSEGEWIKFNGGSNTPEVERKENASKLSQLVQRTPWCTKELAKSQLDGGDFYVYVTPAEDGSKQPRIGIRMKGDSVAEVRGVLSGQEIEPEMNQVAEDFIKNDLPGKGGAKWLDSIAYNKRAIDLLEKIKSNDEITEQDMDDFFVLYAQERLYSTSLRKNGNIESLKKAVFSNNGYVATGKFKDHSYVEVFSGDNVVIFDKNGRAKYLYVDGSIDSQDKILLKGNKLLVNDKFNSEKAGYKEMPSVNASDAKYIFSNLDLVVQQYQESSILKGTSGSIKNETSAEIEFPELEYVGASMSGQIYTPKLKYIRSLYIGKDYSQNQFQNLEEVKDLTIKSTDFVAPQKLSKVKSIDIRFEYDNDGEIREPHNIDISNIERLDSLKIDNFGQNENDVINYSSLKSVEEVFIYQSIGVDFQNISTVGDLTITSGSNISNFGKLKKVKGGLLLNINSVIENTFPLERAGSLTVLSSRISNADSLKIVDGDIKISGNVKSLDGLESAGRIDINRGFVKSMKNLKRAKSIDASASDIENLQSLERVEGDLSLGATDVLNLDSLVHAGSLSLYAVETIKSLPKLESIELILYVEKSSVSDVPNLRTVGGINAQRSNLTKLNSLEKVKGYISIDSLDAIIDSNVEINGDRIGLPNDEYVKTEDFYAMRDAHRAKKAREQAEQRGMSPEEIQAGRDLLSTTMENYKKAIAARTEQMPKRKNAGFDIRQQRLARVPAERELKTFTPEFDESALHRDAVDGVKKFRDKTFAGIKEIGDSVVSSAMRTDELSAKLPADKRATVFSTGAGLPVKEMIRTITDSSPYSAYRIITSAKERINQILEGTLTEDRFLAGVLPMIIGDGKVSLSDYTMSVPSIDNVFIEVDGNYNNQVSSYGAVSMMMNTAAGKELMDAIKSGRQITEESEGAKFILPFAKNLQAIVERIKSALKRFSEYKSAKTPKERMAAIEKMSPVNDVSLAASIAGFGMQKKGSPIARAISGEVQKTGRLSFEPRLQRRAEVLAMATNTDQSLVEAVFADAWSKMPKDENLLDAISYDMLMSEFSYEAEVDMLSLPDNPDSFDIREQRVKRHIRDNPEYKAMRKYVKDNNGKITDRDMLVYLTENFTIGQTDAKDLISGVTGRAFSHSRNVHVDNASKFLRTLSRLFGGNNDQTTREFAYSVGFNMTNYLISIKQFQENVEKATGALMPKAKNAYDAMRLYMSASMQELQPFIEWFHGDKGSIESTKNSFVGRLSKALGGVGNFNDFLLVLHMPERLERKMDLQNQYIMDLIDDINSRFGPIPAGMAATSTTIGGYSYAVHPDAATSKDLQVILLNKKLDAALKKQQGFLDSYAKAMTKREIFVDRIAGPGAYSAAGGNLGNVAKLDKFFEFYNEFRKEMIVPYLNDMLAAGRIDRVRYDHLLNGTSDESSVVWKTYVPFIYSEDAFDQEHGLHDSEISVGAKGIRGISKPEAPNIRAKIMKFFGKGNSSVEVDDMDIIKPLEIAFHRRMLAVKEKHRMEAMRSLAALLKQHANPDEVRVFGSMRVPKKSKYGNFVGSTNYMPKEIMEQSLTYYEDGKMMMIYFADPNDMIFQAMKYQDPENALGPIASIMRTLGAMVKVSITSLSPKFIIRNMLRDPQEALVNLAVETESLDIDQGELYLNYAKRLGQSFGYNFAGALFKTTGFYSELDTYLREYLQAGGAMSWNFTSAEIMAALKEEAEKNIDRAERVGYKNSILDGGAAKVNKLIETLYWFSNAAENQSRLAAYAALRDMGVESNRAAAIAKNVTINFEAKGQQFRQGKRFAWMRDYSLFIGPSLASFGKIFKTLGSPVGRKVLGLHYLGSAALRVLLLGGSAALLGGEGEDEEKQIEEGKVPLSDRLRNYMYSSWIRANYTLILNPFDKDDPLMIPRSYGAGRLVSVMAEGTVDVAAGVRSVSNVSGDILTAVLTTFNPITGASTQFSAFAPWILQPIAETAQNKDYAGRVIRFPQDQNRAYAVGNKSTPQAYYDVARGAYNTLGINIYPDSYRHWFESYVKWLPPAKPVLSIADAVRDYKRDEKAVKSTNEQTWQEYLWEQGKLDFIVYRPNLSQSDKQHLFNFMEITEIKGKAPIVSKRWNMNEIEYMIDALRVIRTKIPTIKETILVGQIQAVAEEMASTGQYDEKIGGDGKFKDLTYGALITRLIKEESGRRIRVEIAKERLRKQGLLPPEER